MNPQSVVGNDLDKVEAWLHHEPAPLARAGGGAVVARHRFSQRLPGGVASVEVGGDVLHALEVGPAGLPRRIPDDAAAVDREREPAGPLDEEQGVVAPEGRTRAVERPLRAGRIRDTAPRTLPRELRVGTTEPGGVVGL